MKERLAGLAQALKLPDVRKRIMFVMWMFALYVACAHVPLPGIDKEALAQLFSGGGFGLGEILDTFAGGSLKRFSVFALGIMPYINASIIFQLLVMAIPSLEELQKEGEYGQRKINAWTKYLTVALAMLQAFGMISWFRAGQAFVGGPFMVVFDVLMMAAGTSFLMWMGDMITERGIGQGVSLIIFVGIMTRMPQDVAQTMTMWANEQIGIANIAFLALIFVATIYGIVKVQQAQRKIPVQYAKRIKGNKVYGGQSSFLPIRVNQAGVIPIIFAISIALFPATIAQFIGNPDVVKSISRIGISEDAISNTLFAVVQFTTPGRNGFATLLYFILVVLFTYFYTAVTFNPEQIAENLQKNGGAVPGIRPGERTRDYLDKILFRITLAGALFLGVIAVMQYYVGTITGVETFTLVGGTSLLIVVGVALDTMQQIEAQLLMRHYQGFLA
ncbi:MAG: preprotein translocase subunit SecY [Armatimonadetes bacterium]|nr:preprotein translocase subunit SecY [Armatimonadota bacterium]